MVIMKKIVNHCFHNTIIKSYAMHAVIITPKIEGLVKTSFFIQTML